MPGLTFPRNPTDGQKISWRYQGTNFEAERSWVFDDSSNSWISSPSTDTILGMISGNSKDSGVARWNYTTFPVGYDGTSFVVNGPSLTSRNFLEVGNGTTTAYGMSVTGSQGITLTNHTSMSFKAVPNGTIIQLTNLSGKYFFSAPNFVDGECS